MIGENDPDWGWQLPQNLFQFTTHLSYDDDLDDDDGDDDDDDDDDDADDDDDDVDDDDVNDDDVNDKGGDGDDELSPKVTMSLQQLAI